MADWYLLGASDPEMDAIAKVLEKQGCNYLFATANGQRVHAGNAYMADPVALLPDEKTLVCIECRPTSGLGDVTVVVIDHHRQGDPGWNQAPRRYWEASSIGQLYRRLRLTPTRDARVLAAMDHCFSAAMRGECPSVTVVDVLNRKITEIAAAKGVSKAAAQKAIKAYRVAFKSSRVVTIGRQQVVDFRNTFLGVGYSLELLTAQVAATQEHKAVLLWHADRKGASNKITLSGHVQPETVTAFMEEWAQEQGLDGVYGNPNRGYAGGYQIVI